jgi:hypothetical protein
MGAVRELGEYVQDAGGDPFKVHAAVDALIGIYKGREGCAEAVARFEGTLWAMSQGIRSLDVDFEWNDYIRSVPWWRRRHERRFEGLWKANRFNERLAEARREVKEIAAHANV